MQIDARGAVQPLRRPAVLRVAIARLPRDKMLKRLACCVTDLRFLEAKAKAAA